MRGRVFRAFALTCAIGVTGCARGCTSSQPPIHLNPSMDDQPKVRPQTASTFFYNGSSMRDPVPGTIPIGGLKEDAAFFTGKDAGGQFIAKIPVPVNEALVARGADRYRLIGHLDVQPVAVGLGIDRHRLDAELPRRLDDAAGDLAAVGDEDLVEHELQPPCGLTRCV